MNVFVTIQDGSYILQPAGYAACIILLLAVLLSICILRHKEESLLHDSLSARDHRHTTPDKKNSRPMRTRELVICSASAALAMVTSFIKFVSLPYGGSITLFSMLFITLTGYFFGWKSGIMTGIAYGILSFIVNPYIYAPAQLLLDYPLAFGALGLSGIFRNRRHGLVLGYSFGVAMRYMFHVISGYIFFAAYAPDNLNPVIYTLGYNLTYILPEMILTILILCIPSVHKSIAKIRRQLTA